MTSDVKIGDTVAIVQGASVTGTVVQAVPKRRLGRTGKLDFSIEHVTAVDGDSIPLRYSINKKEGGSHGLRTGIITSGVAVVFWPAALFFLLMKGKDVTLHKGIVVDVFTDQIHTLKPKPSVEKATTALPAAPAPTAEPCTVVVKSTPDGAEITLDGKYVGSTPSTVRLAPGDHTILVEKSGFKAWQRSMSASAGGIVTIDAALEKLQ